MNADHSEVRPSPTPEPSAPANLTAESASRDAAQTEQDESAAQAPSDGAAVTPAPSAGADPETPITPEPAEETPATEAPLPDPAEVPLPAAEPPSAEAPSEDAPGQESPTAPTEEPAAPEGPAAEPSETPATPAPEGEGSPADAASPTAPAVPAPGVTLGGRYLVINSINEEEASALLGGTVPVVAAELYAVEDSRAYERCWSCGGTENLAGQRFCKDCGALLQTRRLVLARTNKAKGETEEFSENGSYYHLVRPRKQFGTAGLALEVGSWSAEGPHHPNEDSYWTATVGGCYDSKSDMFGVMVLADGMGGYAPGSGLISKMIVNSVGRNVFHLLHNESETAKEEVEIQTVIRSAVAEANSKVLQEIQMHGEMGATLVTAVIHGQSAFIANIGDSRAYYVAPSGAVTQITHDQSLIEQQVAAGLLTADAAFTAFGNNVILHAIGEEGVEEAFDWYIQPLEPGGRLILCTDGYWKTMRHDIWDGETAGGVPTLRDLARSMVESALDRGSDDNTTVVIVGVD